MYRIKKEACMRRELLLPVIAAAGFVELETICEDTRRQGMLLE